MDNYKVFEQKLKNREKVVGPCVQISNTIMLEKMASKVDYFLLDGEHGVFNSENLVHHLQVARLLKKPAIVRVADCNYDLISRVIYMGADGIMIPRCETLDQVKLAVEAMNFYPVGKLGVGGHGQYRENEKFDTFKRYLVLQMESPKGIENLPKMLEKYGEYISAVVIGPYDLSVTLGILEQFDNKKHLEAVQQVFDICKNFNKSTGIFVDTLQKAQQYYDMGANFLWVGTDLNMFVSGFNDLYDSLQGV